MDRAGLESPSEFFRQQPGYAPTPLVELSDLAAACKVAQVWVKDESRRPLGSFKSLGGMYAGLRALAVACQVPSIATLLAERTSQREVPTLICASDGNHGLAVAAAAELAGSTARVYLHADVPAARAARIAARGAEIVTVDGTYDDAVDAAAQAAVRGEGLLIADTSADPQDPVVQDVMAGYGLMAAEIIEQLTPGAEWPTHVFVQAGVGGLAAALAAGLHAHMAPPAKVVVVEPEQAACVCAALAQGQITRMAGELHTAAEMLSCGEASAPAVAILRKHEAVGIAVSEQRLWAAVEKLAQHHGPATTPSGATGMAGLLQASEDPSLAQQLELTPASRVLLIVTEGPVPKSP